mmetsp:Transcript_12197/g.20561  ORF Transcript_12197/g.20561 Transcript_12197/m.20561 type:complete len:172 (+) Transcript_12197:184-699(+)
MMGGGQRPDSDHVLQSRNYNIKLKYKEMLAQMNEDLDMEYRASQRYRDAGAEAMSFEEYQQKKQELHWDVAWQIFDEVNERNEVDRYIDLSCLELDEAVAITKQKIYDLAQISQQDFLDLGGSRPINHILIVQCSKEQLVEADDEYSSSVMEGLRNGIIDMISEELNMDHH